MAGGKVQNLQFKSNLLVLLFVASLWAPMLAQESAEDTLAEDTGVLNTAPYGLASGYGHDIGSTTLDVDGLVQASVREESMFDMWVSTAFNTSSTEHHGTPDVKLTRYDKEHYCWSTEEGPVRTAIHRPNGQWSTTLVDTVASSNSSELVDCAIAITANERPRVLYADGPDLKMGRYAFESPTYWDGARWHTRTIMEDVNPTNLALEITPEGVEWGLMRTATGALHRVNFTGTYWTSAVLDEGPVGQDFELEMDEDGVAHVLYSRINDGEVVLLQVNGTQHETHILFEHEELIDALGMDLDGNNIGQVVSATQTGSTFTLNLIRSLIGQDTGRVDPTPKSVLQGEADEEEGTLLLIDINHDGFDDLVVATPHADGPTRIDNGRVDIYYGSSGGLSPAPSITLTGEVDGAQYGSDVDHGDFNDDGISDLVVGEPGWGPSNASEARHGQVHIFLGQVSGMATTPWATVVGTDSESLGSEVESLNNAAGGDYLAVGARNYSLQVSSNQANNGKVNLYSTDETGLDPLRNITQSEQGNLFGRSLEGCDINNDGYDELIVGNTGSLEEPLSFSSIEYFYGSTTGYDGTPDHTLAPLSQAKLFGLDIACVGDVNGDGYDEHIITEPLNSTGTFGSGVLWLFEGTNAALPGSPDWQFEPTTSGTRVGEAVAAAGDINQDGFDDVYVSSRMGSSSGRVEIFLGSADGLSESRELLAEGNSNEHLGKRLASSGDVDGDGLGDLIYSIRSSARGENYGLDYVHLSERDWESIMFEKQGTLHELELGTAARGETSMVFTHADSLQYHVSKIEHMYDGTPSGEWVDQTIASSTTDHPGIAFGVRSSGQPVLLVENRTSMVLHTTSSMTALQQDVVTTGTMGQWLGSSTTTANEQVLAYTSGGGNQIYVATQTGTGWSTDLVRNSANLAAAIEVNVDSQNIPHLVYRHDATGQLELAVGGSSWSLTALGEEGEAVSKQHPTTVLSNDSIAVGLVASNQSGTHLAVWVYDGTALFRHNITNHSDLNGELQLTTLSNGSLLLASLTVDGSLSAYELWPGSSEWHEHTVPQPSGTSNEFRLDLAGGDNPVLAVRGNAATSILGLNETGVWVSLAERPDAAVNGAWDIVHLGDHLLLLTSDPITHQLTVNTLELNRSHPDAQWMSVSFGNIIANEPVNAVLDSNGTVQMAYWETVDDDVVVLRLYADQDRDLVFDLIDAMPTVGNQWKNSDGDAYGDNPLGPLPDACPTSAGTSAYVLQGCADFDTDGFRDDIDGCDDEGGTSWIDRFGCEDRDQDGWSDNLQGYLNGDGYYSNWKQARDSDGDGVPDNHGVDCCATVLDPNAGNGDLFPHLPTQNSDYDGDGYGDNDTDLVYGDYCPFNFGTSYRDRNGCLDSDGDGASDPSDEGTIFEWNGTSGADLWPQDSTQWKDSDGDGYGDNQSENATNPDRFPLRKAAANDTDNDGYADNWTAFVSMDDDSDGVMNLIDICVDSNTSLEIGANGCDEEQQAVAFPKTSYKQGIELDACPTVWGNSTRQSLSDSVYGCPDADGDGYTDAYTYDLDQETGLRINELGDALPYEKTQSRDRDGDGFGDNPTGVEGDRCPVEPGVLNGTNGIGCRVIDAADNDGDGIINELDTRCPTTPQGEPVNEQGCSQSELDDDDDGIKNNADLCPETPTGVTVDADGCTPEQRTLDSDSDGVNDPEDTCPKTGLGDLVDENGCSESQRDSDGDGILDVEDDCNDTPQDFPILPNGCTDEDALDVDLDGDGYTGRYTYGLDESTGEIINEQGDAFPSDSTQWFDRDGDGYGDNPAGNDSDVWPTDATQWKDTDGDGYGDNWGESSWNTTRNASWPGQFVPGATNADFCPKTTPGLTVDEEGCHISERDSDFDGVMDDSDNCPNDPNGVDGYDDGCPYIPASGDGEEGLLGVDAGIVMLALGGLGAFLLLTLVIVRVMRRGDDDDDEDDDYADFFDDDDDDEDNFLDRFDRKTAAPPTRSRAMPERTAPSRRSGPSGPGPTSSPARQSGGPPKRGPGGPPRRGPNTPPASTKAPAPKKASRKKVVQNDEDSPAAKVRKAKITVDLSIFEDWQADDREAAVDWVVGAMTDGEQERTMLMQLQETGWTAEQSRAICNLAKNKRS